MHNIKFYQIRNIHLLGLILLIILPCVAFSQINWEKLDGPYCGTANCFAIGADGVMYTGTYGNGVYLSNDSGRSWTRMDIDYGLDYDGTVRGIALSPDNRLYIGTSGLGVYRSDVNGANWERIVNGLDYMHIRTLKTAPNGIVYAGTFGGVYTISDDDDSLTRKSIGLGTKEVYSFIFLSSDTVIASTIGDLTGEGGVYISYDGATSWQYISEGIPDSWVFSIEIDPDGVLYAGTKDSGVYKSSNLGESWEEAGNGLSATIILSLFADNSGSIYAGTRGEGIWKSNDKGENWSRVLPETRGIQVQTITKGPGNNIFAGMWGGGILSSKDGSSWERSNSGFNASIVNDIHFTRQDNLFLGTNGDGVYTFNTDQLTFQRLKNGIEYRIITTLSEDADGVIYAGTYDEGIYYSSDAGNSWQTTASQPENQNINDLMIDNDGNIYAATSGGGIFRSNDNGESWSTINDGFNPDLSKDCPALLNTNSDYIFSSVRQFGIYRSNNSGELWEQVNTGFSAPTALSLELDEHGNIYAGTLGSGVFKSSNNGDSWYKAWDDMGRGLDVNVVHAQSNGPVYAGCRRKGIYVDYDGGPLWAAENGGLENKTIHSVISDNRDYVYVGTDGGGFYRSLEPVSVEDQTNMGTDQFSVNVYPNPVIEKCTLSISNHPSGVISISLYDLHGRLISEIKGRWNKYLIDMSGFPSGIYFVVVRSGIFSKYKKFIKAE